MAYDVTTEIDEAESFTTQEQYYFAAKALMIAMRENPLQDPLECALTIVANKYPAVIATDLVEAYVSNLAEKKSQNITKTR